MSIVRSVTIIVCIASFSASRLLTNPGESISVNACDLPQDKQNCNLTKSLIIGNATFYSNLVKERIHNNHHQLFNNVIQLLTQHNNASQALKRALGVLYSIRRHLAICKCHRCKSAKSHLDVNIEDFARKVLPPSSRSESHTQSGIKKQRSQEQNAMCILCTATNRVQQQYGYCVRQTIGPNNNVIRYFYVTDPRQAFNGIYS